MATTVNSAFDQFMADHVNLDPDVTSLARASRDWLVNQIAALPGRHADFPPLYPDVDVHYGSFARKTKIRELDDLDMIIGLKALGTTYHRVDGQVRLTVPNGIVLAGLCHDGTNQLNSRRVINRFVSGLTEVPQYEQAQIKRNGSAAVLKLKSYSWSYDIVPGFFTVPEEDGRTYYIIPDGDGHWMKTDPRIDQERISAVNQAHDGRVLRALRLVKFWNRRPTMPSIPPYMLETLILSHYETAATKATDYVDLEFIPILESLAVSVLGAVSDPKRIQGDLNSLAVEERIAVSSRAFSDTVRAKAARRAEQNNDHRTSIAAWGEILGPSFPTYG